jgi:general secretion pathway protein A
MFETFFGFNHQPFGTTPDPRYLHWTRAHQEAMASLYYGIESGCGFMTLIASPGMGKTTLLFHLLERLKETSRTAYIFQTQCSSSEFLRCMMADLGWNASEQDLVTLYVKLYELLVADANAGKRFVLVVDEAQNLDDSVLETVRLLTNFETPNRKLMQVILAGQPQLSSKLAKLELWQLRQRISIMSRLEPLTPPEVTEYVQHRLTVAGYRGAPMFVPRALDLIATASGGIPRIINNLCFNALSLAYAQRQKTVTVPMIREAATDLQLEIPPDKEEAPSPVQEHVASPKPAAAVRKPDLHQVLGVVRGWISDPVNLKVGAVLASLLLVVSVSISVMHRKPPAVHDPTLPAAATPASAKAEPSEAENRDLSELRTMSTSPMSIRYMMVNVKSDESLDLVAEKYLGRKMNPRMLDKILLLNPQITDPRRMEVVRRVRLPLAESRIASSPLFFQQGTRP